MSVAPQQNLEDKKNFVTDDFRAIANFQGYLDYNENQTVSSKVILPLKLQGIKLVRERDEPKITLDCDCAEIRLDYMVDSHSELSDWVNLITVNFRDPRTGANNVCRIEPTGIYVKKSMHYTCVQSKHYECKSETGETFLLFATALEFEVDGDSEKLKAREFSTPPQYCA